MFPPFDFRFITAHLAPLELLLTNKTAKTVIPHTPGGCTDDIGCKVLRFAIAVFAAPPFWQDAHELSQRHVGGVLRLVSPLRVSQTSPKVLLVRIAIMPVQNRVDILFVQQSSVEDLFSNPDERFDSSISAAPPASVTNEDRNAIDQKFILVRKISFPHVGNKLRCRSD